MFKQKALIDFSHVKDNDLVEVAQLIHNKMRDSAAIFTDPDPTLETLQTDITNYSTALIKSKDGTKADTADKNVKRRTLTSTLSDLGGYVNDRADGDTVILDLSGFPLSKIPSPIGVLPAPAKFDVSEGIEPGQVKVAIGKVERASGYIVLYSQVPPPANDSQWLSKTFSKTEGTISGLESGKKYIFKAAGTSAESNRLSSYDFGVTVEKIIQ